MFSVIFNKIHTSRNVINFSDGRSRAGVYCAANACIEQVIQHGEVDVFQAVKTVRRHRPQLIESMVNIVYFRRCNLIITKNSLIACYIAIAKHGVR